MDAIKFVREKQRMCNSFGDICNRNCPLKSELFGCLITAENISPERIVSKVEQWSKEHPLVSNGDMVVGFINRTEHAKGFVAGREGDEIHIRIDADWWNAEYKEE